MILRTLLLLTTAILLASEPAFAGGPVPGGTPAACGQGGVILEQASRDSTFDIYLTDCSGKGTRIGGVPFTTVVGNNLIVNIPGTWLGQKVGDVRNITRRRRSPDGEGADLSLESLYLDAMGQVLFEDVFGRIAAELGVGVMVYVPDLYADTNGNGGLDAGDLLYSFVDMHQYLQAIPTFSLGDHFSIVNGEVAGLPGMLFSTTEFVSDPNSPNGVDFTPYTGDGEAGSLHGIQATPEPCSFLLVGAGILGILRFGRRRMVAL